uniref:Aminoacyl tRNA synthetase complex interacting multifunctional protein 1b n=1 Tax=Fundulus heteroclitus TaxID=8078 RepID=A0A3Q2QNQ3_FUNHE
MMTSCLGSGSPHHQMTRESGRRSEMGISQSSRQSYFLSVCFCSDNSGTTDGLAAALKKLDPEDGEQMMEYFKTQALLSREKASKALLSQVPPPPRVSPALTKADTAAPTNHPPPSATLTEGRDRPSRRRRGERKARPKSEPLPLEAESRIDASRLDLRVGKFLSIRRHPLAEAMSVQEVDVGESCPRTIVSKLGGVEDLDELQGSLGVFLCNVKASKMRGVVSQGRLLCCSTSDVSVELLAPPADSTPGDRITFLNYPGEPDRELPSKQKIWELLQPDLQVDGKGVANYKGCGFEVKGKGLCRAPSLTNCTIR